ncbi:hypothetical protein MNR02_14650 [Shinella sp. H4-D48]|uniref:hypothetical protein n=1 Tax=Shinella sp. H4-D48 TaxID=2925841 RepID=UPI001F53A26D|nr:hypothetical protein [Shinella sp. H4-D48]UNK37688.1 hypothetical protein MNR02_14650 [Shinella sp. H4-D48]
MGKAVKKEPIVSTLEQYQSQFRSAVQAATAFEKHESQGQKLLYIALERIFAFGEEIRGDMKAFEEFLAASGESLNKVTKANPYNALVGMAFSSTRSKSWCSERANVLLYASETAGDTPLVDWLENGGGVSGRYAEAVQHFARPAAGKAASLRSSRLASITSRLQQARVVTEALPGVTLANGFHRSLLFSEGGQTFLVHVRDEDDQKIIEKYLLEVAGNATPNNHPLADRQLYPLFRAIDLILGTCIPSHKGTGLIAIWNEVEDNGALTKLRFLSSAHSFTNATVTLKAALPELDGQGYLILDSEDAEMFRERFADDHSWRVEAGDEGIVIVDDAKSQTRLKLRPIANYADAKLRQGKKLGRRTRHFVATCEGMKASAKNLETAANLSKLRNKDRLTDVVKPKRFKWLYPSQPEDLLEEPPRKVTLEVGVADVAAYSMLSYPFLSRAEMVEPIDPQMELSFVDIAAFLKVASAYAEDLNGYIADSDVRDAAFCIDHIFGDGDRFEYVSPMVLGVSMARTKVCEDFTAAPVMPQAPATSRPRDYSLIEANRRKKTNFPAIPSSSGRVFGAFITSFMPDDAELKAARKFNFEWQLEWWRRMTDIPVHVIASNWADEEVAASTELDRLSDHGGSITRVGPRILIENRIDCLNQLYASDFDWGIIMDDDAVLMQAENHNSSYRLFAEMAANGISAYDGVDLFAPIYGRKAPFNDELNGPGNPYADNHVFKKSTDLKGSMIVVRNFVKEGKAPLLPDPNFRCHGEDTYLTLKAVSMGYSPMTSWNMVLEELAGDSTFATTDDDRTEKMREGHERLVSEFGHLGLRMKPNSHALDKREFEKQSLGGKAKQVSVPKPR